MTWNEGVEEGGKKDILSAIVVTADADKNAILLTVKNVDWNC